LIAAGILCRDREIWDEALYGEAWREKGIVENKIAQSAKKAMDAAQNRIRHCLAGLHESLTPKEWTRRYTAVSRKRSTDRVQTDDRASGARLLAER
jgi:hypothetical protein